MNDLKTKLGTIVIACLLMTTVQAQSLQGKWTVEKVTIEKNTDGKVQTTVYDSAAEVQSYIPCMKELVVNAQNITLRYPSGWEETAKYTLDGNQLKIMAATAMQSYQYSLNGASLILTVTYNYVNNLPTGQTKQIEEKWIINLVKNL